MKNDDEGKTPKANNPTMALTPELDRRLDEIAERLSSPSYRPTREEVLGTVILRGLELMEQTDAPVSAKSAPPS